jgi:hypothetical protein
MNEQVKPITPQEASLKLELPAAVIRAFNRLISERFTVNGCRITQTDAMTAVLEELKKDGVTKTNPRPLDSDDLKVPLCAQDVVNRGWLDVEPVYRNAGWHVEYDKPGYNEDYEAFFIFKKK